MGDEQKKIPFKKSGKVWQDYVLDKRLEISCGEAPYLVSRYDAVTGDIIEPRNRIGILDRKLRVVNENATDDDWMYWVKCAFQSSYGYEWQGDSLLISRENLLYTFRDYYFEKYEEQPSIDIQVEIATIISWNIWQMDGLKGVIPNSCRNINITEYSLFGEHTTKELCEGCKKDNLLNHNGIYCKVRDWEAVKKHDKSVFRFVDLFDNNGGK